MQDPELLELTASDPLTLDEEIEMQRKWHLDEDKLTFIILARESSSSDLSLKDIKTFPMVGDVNLFLKSPDEVECEVMIAERRFRRKGIALEALRLLLQYATSSSISSSLHVSNNLPVSPQSLVVRIGASNTSSIALFRRLGFSISKHVEVFNEVEMKFGWNAEKEEHEEVEALTETWKESDLTQILYDYC